MKTKTIWKWKLDPVSSQSVLVPAGAKFVSAFEQAGGMVIYAIVDPRELERVQASIVILGTGHHFDELLLTSYDFLCSIPTRAGFVWHVFVEKAFR